MSIESEVRDLMGGIPEDFDWDGAVTEIPVYVHSKLRELGEEIKYKSFHHPESVINIDLVNSKIDNAVNRMCEPTSNTES